DTLSSINHFGVDLSAESKHIRSASASRRGAEVKSFYVSFGRNMGSERDPRLKPETDSPLYVSNLIVKIKSIILSLLFASALPSLADDSSGYPSDWVKFAAQKCNLTYWGVTDRFGSKPYY